MSFSTLIIQDLVYERDQRCLFRDVNCVIKPGEVLSIYGANGSGKSTLLRMLAGYIEPLGGKILWENKYIAEKRDEYQQQLHYIGHQNAIKPYLTVHENLQLQSCLANTHIPQHQMTDTIKKIHLTSFQKTLALHLSAGQKRRLALARLLLHPATLWLLDEPTTALDITGQLLFTEWLNQHLKKGGMAVVATHQPLSVGGKSITLGEQHG